LQERSTEHVHSSPHSTDWIWPTLPQANWTAEATHVILLGWAGWWLSAKEIKAGLRR
jgi:hypothetical protein